MNPWILDFMSGLRVFQWYFWLYAILVVGTDLKISPRCKMRFHCSKPKELWKSHETLRAQDVSSSCSSPIIHPPPRSCWFYTHGLSLHHLLLGLLWRAPHLPLILYLLLPIHCLHLKPKWSFPNSNLVMLLPPVYILHGPLIGFIRKIELFNRF